jgi:hypothetical protein
VLFLLIEESVTNAQLKCFQTYNKSKKHDRGTDIDRQLQRDTERKVKHKELIPLADILQMDRSRYDWMVPLYEHIHYYMYISPQPWVLKHRYVQNAPVRRLLLNTEFLEYAATEAKSQAFEIILARGKY